MTSDSGEYRPQSPQEVRAEVKEFPPCLKIRATFFDEHAKCYYVYDMGIVDIEMLTRQLENFQLFVDEIWPYLVEGKDITEFEEDYPRYEK